MITQRPSLIKIISFLGILTNAFSLEANENLCKKDTDVLVRKGKNGYSLVKRQLEDLYCNKGFEGKYFKIVYKKDDNAIKFDDASDLVKRASNVYYHLTEARKFWVLDMNSDYVKNMDQITVRIQITNGFSRIGHFKNESVEENFNNAWTIPAGETPPWVENPHKWGREIWFSPLKKIESRKLITSNGNNPLTNQLQALQGPVIDYTQGSLTQNILDHLFYPTHQATTLLDTVVSHIGTLGIMFGLTELSKRMDKIFMEKYYYIDTSMIPEIIYHEFAHVALSDHLNPIHSVPIIEGMADYFATRITGTVKMYRSIKHFSTNAEKNAHSKKFYHPYLELQNNAESDFTLSVLWLVKAEMDKQNAKRQSVGIEIISNPDLLIYESRKAMNAESSLLNMTQALRSTCASSFVICTSKRIGVGVLDQVFSKKGF